MDPILQQLQHYYQQQRSPQHAPQKLVNTTPVFNPWWLKLRQNLHQNLHQNLQGHAANSAVKTDKQLAHPND